jgi:hypothetical protein
MRTRVLIPTTAGLALAATLGCTLSLFTSPTPVPTPTIVSPTSSPVPPSPTATFPGPTLPPTAVPPTAAPGTFIPPTSIPPTQVPPAVFCADPQVTALINGLKSALQSADGALLASLVSPASGMDVRYYRDGRVVNYDTVHARFLFDSTYVVDWGLAPGSGLPTKGSFHEVVVPALLAVFNKSYTLSCNQLVVGGTTYNAAWPYPGVKYYSIYYPGTEANGYLDWHTWLAGAEYVGSKPYLYALVQFEWEP